MGNEKQLDVLNSLVQINNDRIEGYETASKETNEQDLKSLFAQFIQTSQKCQSELVDEITSLGGTPTEGTKNAGKFFRVWMDVKAALTNKDRKTILDSCEFGEDQAVHTYNHVIKNDLSELSDAQRTMVNSQQVWIKADHDHVKKLRDSVLQNA